MLRILYNRLRSLFYRRPVRLAIVRRYADANGNYVGELYMERTVNGVSSYDMVGVSLDSFWLGQGELTLASRSGVLDTRNDFLALMPPATIRVGAINPQDNDSVRRMVARLPTKGMHFVIQNRFIEHVMEKRTA